MLKLASALLLTSLFFGCASVTKTDRQNVFFVWEGKRDKTATFHCQDGTFEFADGIGVAAMNRSREDIPVWVQCGGRTHAFVMKSSTDIMRGIIGNIFIGGVPGWIADFSGDKGFDYDSPVRLDEYCK